MLTQRIHLDRTEPLRARMDDLAVNHNLQQYERLIRRATEPPSCIRGMLQALFRLRFSASKPDGISDPIPDTHG